MARGENTAQGGTQWLCRCECGTEKTINGIVLRDGRSRSCGCLHRDSCIERSTKHGHTPMGVKPTPTYHSWCAMKARCTKPSNNRYADYGGRGITVCDRWLNSFAAFLTDMGEKPAGTSIERKDNSKGYEPGNCEWADNQKQANNKRNNRRLSLNGRTQTMRQWSKEIGINYGTLQDRLLNGWSDADALTVPVAHKFSN